MADNDTNLYYLQGNKSTVNYWMNYIVLPDMNFSTGINSGNEGLYWLSELKK